MPTAPAGCETISEFAERADDLIDRGEAITTLPSLVYLIPMRPMLEGLKDALGELAAPRPPGQKARPYVWQMVWDLAVVLEESGARLSCGRDGILHRLLVEILNSGTFADDFTYYNDEVLGALKRLRARYPRSKFILHPHRHQHAYRFPRTPLQARRHRRFQFEAVIERRGGTNPLVFDSISPLPRNKSADL